MQLAWLLKNGDIFIAVLDPTVGSEINKSRPIIIVSNNVANSYSNTVSVVPVTSNTDNIFPYEVLLQAGEGNLPKLSKAKADQIRTLDKGRLAKLIGTLDAERLKEVEQSLRIHLGL